MRFVRFENKTNGTGCDYSYGLYEDGKVTQLEGSIFEKYKKTDKVFAVADLKLLYPCVPTNLYCVGLNFLEHINELGFPIPEKPANFLKPVSGVINPGEKIIIPKIATRVDYEGEMAIIIKDKIKDVSVEDALSHVLGVTPLNDVTERDLSNTSTLVTYCKSFDTFTSFGPIIDTDVDPENTVVRTFLNGKMVQEGKTSDFLFSCAEIVSFFSKDRTLFPGDVISTGTPSNVMGIKDGDIVEIEVEGIPMRLSNGVYDPRKH